MKFGRFKTARAKSRLDLSTTHLKDEIYTPLRHDTDSIRLLTVCPKEQWELGPPILRAHLHPASSVSACGPYIALSYTWGNSLPQNWIILNNRSFRVRQNLYDFLYEFRGKGERSALWVDAICIDQNNVKERNHQVGLMNQIYTNAESVCIWLGNFPPALDRKFEKLEELCAHKADGVMDLAQCDAEMQGFRTALDWIASRHYWSRLWIVQENILAKTRQIVLKGRSFDWSFLVWAYRTFDMARYIETSHASFQRILDAEGLQNALDLESLMLAFGYSMCQEPRDRVYGLLGVASDFASGHSFVVDYTEPVERLFSRVLNATQRPTLATACRLSAALEVRIAGGIPSVVASRGELIPLHVALADLVQPMRGSTGRRPVFVFGETVAPSASPVRSDKVPASPMRMHASQHLLLRHRGRLDVGDLLYLLMPRRDVYTLDTPLIPTDTIALVVPRSAPYRLHMGFEVAHESGTPSGEQYLVTAEDKRQIANIIARTTYSVDRKNDLILSFDIVDLQDLFLRSRCSFYDDELQHSEFGHEPFLPSARRRFRRRTRGTDVS